jgi:glucose-6-phosphate 1-dehydrogenase
MPATASGPAVTAGKVLPGRQVPPATLVIFGAAEDVTKRLVAQALYQLVQAGKLASDLAIIGIDHIDQTTEQWRESLNKVLQAFTQESGINSEAWSWLAQRMSFMSGDFTQPGTFDHLKRLLVERKQNSTSNILFYLAVAEQFLAPIVEQLGQAGLTQQSEGSWRRVIVERPFGHDLASAQALNAKVLTVLSEDQIYRTDHFPGKEMVQNILVLRFANGIFEPLWNRDHIDNVQITAAEMEGVEDRGRFYDKMGALRDMAQNHLFQLLAMIGMEPPISFDADAVHAKKTKLFQAIHPISPENAVRGQYGPGMVLGRKVHGYRQEPNVSPDSPTETFVALKLEIDNWRWAGVPFYLRTGKRLSAHTSEIAVQFRRAAHAMFRNTPVERLPANILTLRIQPDEGLSLSFSAKRPGSEIQIDRVAVDFAYRDYFEPIAAAGSETRIYDCLIGDATRFQRADTVETAWRAVQRLLDSWTRDPANDFPNYVAGGSGPEAADRLLARDERAWLPIR